jgi:hypothetical protein
VCPKMSELKAEARREAALLVGTWYSTVIVHVRRRLRHAGTEVGLYLFCNTSVVQQYIS